jgi:hypothetical protein
MKHTNVLIWFFALVLVSVPLVDVSAAPSGAVKLSKSKLSKKSGFYCGNVKKSSWIPGKLISGRYFYSHQAEKANLAKQLKKASAKKKATIQGKIDALNALIAARAGQCPAGGGGSTGGGKALRFNFSGAVGLALKPKTSASALLSGQSSAQSNLQKVDGAGRQSEVVASGSATVSQFLIAPNDKLYVLFDSGTNLSDTSKTGGCLLAEVSTATGIPTCIEDQLTSVQWLESNASSLKNKSIQFDGSGAIYYLARKNAGALVLRRYAGGTKTDLINDNISVSDFLVLSDGRVIVTGTTQSTNTRWIRRIAASGGLTNLYSGDESSFLALFPDGNVYVGGHTAVTGFGWGVGRYLTQADLADTRPYFSYPQQNPYFSSSLVCDMNGVPAGFCYGNGGLVKAIHKNTNGQVYAIASASSGSGTLMRYYPDLAKVSTAVNKVLVFQGVISNLILAGLNSSNKNIMTLFNTTDNSELELIGAANEIEIYHLNYVAAENKIMFDGLRFSDNKYVIGQYDLNTMTLSASQTGSTKLVDFQTF